MALIAADNRDVERSLQKLMTLSKKAGAEFSDNMVVKCIDGNLSIEAPPDSFGQELMWLPWHCLVPLKPFNLSVVNDDIVISSHDEGLARASIARMEAFLELYNLTHKLALHRRTSPWPVVASHPELLAYVTRGRGRGAYVISDKLYEPGKENELLLRSFLNSRVFSYKTRGQQSPAQEIQVEVLLPILDSMNHHFHGALYSYCQRDKDRYLTVRRSVPLPEMAPEMANECFAYYGWHDSFDTWMTYGFIDESVPFVCSAPMRLDLPDLGTIEVGHVIQNRAAGEFPESEKDLYFYIPKLLARRKNHIEVSSLLIPGPGAPRALRRALHLLITEMRPAHPRQSDLVLLAEQQIVAANANYFRNLRALLHSLSPKDPLQQPILENFIRVCDLQLARIRNYCFYPK
jgi:hypothetical protein